MMQEDYYSVLARMIAATAQDESQLRRMVYELARNKLRRQLYLQYQHLRRPDIEDQLIELETAITQLESDAAQDVPLLSLPQRSSMGGGELANSSTGKELVLHQSTVQATVLNAHLVEILGPASSVPVSLQRLEPSRPLPPLGEMGASYRPVWQSEPPRSKSWFKVHLAAAAIVGIAIFAAFERHPDIIGLLGLRAPPPSIAAADGPLQAVPQVSQVPAARRPDPGFPVPTSYGVYALDGGRLVGLDPLPIRVPDARVAISGVISQPSPTTLPDGRLRFVVFRRDLMNDAPDRVVVRVVAQVMHALTFSGGKATVTNVDDAWAVRGNSYEMKVAPVDSNPEMIVIRPQKDDFLFPAGRYALVLKNASYDFAVAGAVTDTAHCLERTDTLETPLFSECRHP
jgi:hypothetical protein